jgi:hypothetical protein
MLEHESVCIGFMIGMLYRSSQYRDESQNIDIKKAIPLYRAVSALPGIIRPNKFTYQLHYPVPSSPELLSSGSLF